MAGKRIGSEEGRWSPEISISGPLEEVFQEQRVVLPRGRAPAVAPVVPIKRESKCQQLYRELFQA